MTKSDDHPRHSLASDPKLVEGGEDRKSLEVRNHFRQYDSGLKIIKRALESGKFTLRPSTILLLHREGYEGLSYFAGAYRPGLVQIEGSEFQPPDAPLVPELIEEMCDYVNGRWNSTTPIHLAAFLMWRINWIHPFVEGNGSTARILSYVVLSIRWGAVLPGTPTIPEQIVSERQRYFKALEHADAAWRQGKIDVSKMEELLAALLANQLSGLYQAMSRKIAD
jgi:Fic family protein